MIESGLCKAGNKAEMGLRAAVSRGVGSGGPIQGVCPVGIEHIPIPTFIQCSVLSRLTSHFRLESDAACFDPEPSTMIPMFALEILHVSLFNLLPSHVYIRNITDIDIKFQHVQPSLRTTVGVLTRIHPCSSYAARAWMSRSGSKTRGRPLALARVTGLIVSTLPKKGVDMNVTVLLILGERSIRGAFPHNR